MSIVYISWGVLFEVCNISIANALVILQFYTKPLICLCLFAMQAELSAYVFSSAILYSHIWH